MHTLAHLNKHTVYPAPLLCLALYLGEKQQQLKTLLCIWFLALVSVTSSLATTRPQQILARGGCGSPVSSARVPRAQRLVLGVESRSSRSSHRPPGSAKRAWKQNIKETKGTRWDLHRLNGQLVGSTRKNDPKCLKIQKKKKAKRQQENVLLIWPYRSKRDGLRICLGQLKPVFAELHRSSRNTPTNTHSSFMAENCRTVYVTQIHIQDSITVPLGGNWDGLGRQQPLKTGMIICRFFRSYHLSLIWKLNAYVPSC